MRDWNAVISVHEGGFVQACRHLEQFGPVMKTDFFNILVMRAEEPFHVLADLQGQLDSNPAIATWISRFVPLQRRFAFQSVEEFELRSREAVLDWCPRLANARFHVRVHRRGFKGRLSSLDEERFLDEYLLQKLSESGTPGAIAFTDPDVIIDVETVGPQAGFALFLREDLKRFSLLHLD